ncbi:DUF397 domain-containing protein [Kitasatospora sp. NPDC056783]|uniref:DUF397 domain-containing protein n=1 Tax=Kitasatospora sp. NPDC056783 TaxID=3345943 RepID=UPI0036C11365
MAARSVAQVHHCTERQAEVTFVPNSTALTVRWRKSPHSGGNGDCVELAASEDIRYVRDSKDPVGPALAFSVAAHSSFIAAAATGAFDFDLI